jgi:hypothetical protein
LAKQAKQPSVEPVFFDLGLSLKDFCDDRAQVETNRILKMLR